MGQDGQPGRYFGNWRQRALIALGVFCALLLVFHRPVLLSLGHAVVSHLAAERNLKADFRLEGNVFTTLTIRNLHAVPTGPSDFESADADFVRIDYSLITLLRKGTSDGIRNLDARSVRLVLNPAGRPARRRLQNLHKKTTLFDFFPERVHLADVSLVVRDKPHDLVVEHLDADLDPKNSGQLKIGRLQLEGGQTWNGIAALTNYTDRNLILRDLVLSGAEQIRSLSLDATDIDNRKLTVRLDYPIAPGNLSASLELHEAQASLETSLHLKAVNVPAGFINKYAELPENFVTGKIESLDIALSGLLNSPRTWTGAVAAQLADFHQSGLGFDRAVIQIAAQNGSAILQSGDITEGQNESHLRGSIVLPDRLEDFGRATASIEGTATAPDLAQATAGLPRKLRGSAQLNGKVDLRDSIIHGDFMLAATALAFDEGEIGKLDGSFKVTKKLSPTNSKKPWFTDLETNGSLTTSGVKFRDYAADTTDVSLHSSGDSVKIDRSIVRRSQDEFIMMGEYRLPVDFRDATKQPAKLDLSLTAGEVGDYWAGDSANKITGPLQMNCQLDWKDGEANGQFSVYGQEMRMRDLVVHQLSAQCSVAHSIVYLNDFTASLNQRDFVNANASFDLHSPLDYRGKLTVNILDLATLQPLLRAFGNQKKLAGSFTVNWDGSGMAKTFKNSGKLNLALTNGRFGTMQSLQANVDADYSPDKLQISQIFFRSDKMDFQAIARAEGPTFEIDKIQIDQGQAKYATGYISFPFVWKNLGTSAPVSPADGKVSINVQSENLDLKKLFEDFGTKAPLSGTMNVRMDAQGTLAKLNGRADLQMRDLRSTDFANLEPAALDLSAIAQDSQLNINGKLQQAKIQPLELTASFPFDLPAIVRARNLPDKTPVMAKLQLPRTSVNFIRQFVPDLTQVDGDAGLDVNVSGTVGNPVLSGAGDITINVARTTNSTFPALTNFKARISFERDTLTVQQFAGELSGGKFSVNGGVRFPRLTQPVLDLSIKSDSALIARNDTVTARVDTDVKIVGPFNAATVTGTVATTNSQFLKNIDLLPIGLPGRPPPQPTEARPDISFPAPPLRDWKFDVALKTKEPFRIRGNMASGGAVADLHFIGTGLHPGIQGMVRMEKVEATLPFSRLEVSYGYLTFDPSDSFNPKIEMQGTSVIRDYIIHVYVYGTALSPEAVFTSEPPLPQEEVISLLATGATREELTGNNNVLAGRAATLLVQQLYRKIFKSGGGTQSSSVFDRLDVDIGQTDPRTGQREATARFKVNDQFVLLGDLDVAGGFKGMVKYLIRFH